MNWNDKFDNISKMKVITKVRKENTDLLWCDHVWDDFPLLRNFPWNMSYKQLTLVDS